MLEGEIIFPFVLQFHGHPSTHLWEDEEGVVQEIPQSEGGEQEVVRLGSSTSLRSNRGVFSAIGHVDGFDDVHVTTPPERTATVEQSVEVNFWSHAPVNQKKTQLENR